MIWDIWIMVLLLFVSVCVPARLAFVEDESTEWIIIYALIDSFFFLDILLSFFTAIDDDQKVYSITDRKLIAKNYLRGWFFIDIISILPIDVIFFASQNEATALARFSKIGKLYKLIRMFRLAKVLKLLKSKEKMIE